VLARSYEHLVGAYGVVGLSGVKDARRAFSLPTRSRVGLLTSRRGASAVQTVCKQALNNTMFTIHKAAWCICCASGVDLVCILDKDWTFARPTDARGRCLTARNLKC